jgi:FkbM family methyltransferase
MPRRREGDRASPIRFASLDPESCPRSSRSYVQLARDVRAHPFALSNLSGEATLFVPTNDNLGEGSLQRRVDSTRTVIRAMTADEWMETADLGSPARIDVIKLDVQGHEWHVLESAHEMIARFKPIILCELEERWLKLPGTSSADLKAYAASLGYTVNRITGTRLRRIPLDEVRYFENVALIPGS